MQKSTPCRIAECAKLAFKAGLCSAHYQSELAAGRVPRAKGDPCAIDGCNVTASVAGMCNKHYRRVKAHGDPHALIKKPIKRTDTHKECVTCREMLPYEAFNRSSRSIDGRQAMCRLCARSAIGSWYDKNRVKARADAKRWNRENPEQAADHHYLVRYGITYAEYCAIAESQNGLCAICHCPQSNGRRLYVDHNHYTGEVRALLCHKCNLGISNFNEDRELLAAAAKYLASFSSQ